MRGMTAVSAAIRDSFDRSFGMYRDLLALLDEHALASKLAGVPSNAIGGQLWCVVGARESYARAIAAGRWDGFSCSLLEPGDPAQVTDALDRSAAAVSEQLGDVDQFGDAQVRLLLDLLEHETQHQGQLIRYLYGLRLPVPDSWKARYALD
jgi:hypothetical protein